MLGDEDRPARQALEEDATEGEDIGEHMARKYGGTPDQMRKNQDEIQQRGAELGFTFDRSKRNRIVRTYPELIAFKIIFGARLGSMSGCSEVITGPSTSPPLGGMERDIATETTPGIAPRRSVTSLPAASPPTAPGP